MKNKTIAQLFTRRNAEIAFSSTVFALSAAILIFESTSKEQQLRSAIAAYHNAPTSIEILSFCPVSANYVDSSQVAALLKKHKRFGDLQLNEMRIGGAYADMYADSMERTASRIVAIKASPTKTETPILCRYIVTFNTDTKRFLDTLSSVIDNGRLIY